MISVRPARESDRHLLLEWRNDPQTRSSSLNHDSVTEPEHDVWFTRALADPGVLLYVGEVDGVPAGTVRFDRDPAGLAAEVSINLDPAHRGRGLARSLLTQAIDAMRAETGGAETLLARILPVNAVSLRLFAQAGFLPVGRDESGVELYELPAHGPATPAAPS